MRQTDLFAIPPFNIRTLNFRYTFFVCKILWAIIRRNINTSLILRTFFIACGLSWSMRNGFGLTSGKIGQFIIVFGSLI